MAGSGRERILAIDVVRGLAVVGMLLVNNAGIPAAMPQELRHASWQGLTLADQVFPLLHTGDHDGAPLPWRHATRACP